VSRLVERKKFINVGLSKYVDFWKVEITQSLTYEMKMKSYMEYWEDILLHLSRTFPLKGATILEGFWPSTNWRSNFAKDSLSTIMDVANAKDLI